MRRVLSLFTALGILYATFCPTALANTLQGYQDSGVDVEVLDSRNLTLEGSVEPTIINVTMPSYLPFDISKSQPSDNKVISPKIEITNHSSVPVSVYVDNTQIDLSDLGGASWTNHSQVNSNEIAIGMMRAQDQPTSLWGAMWLEDGRQHTKLTSLNPGGKDRLYVVGALGSQVPEGRRFTVTATLVVSQY